MQHSIRAIHFIGIGGAGMSGLAEVMAGLGYRVSGSDVSEQKSLARLRARGIQVYIGHAAAHISDADCAVYSSAIAADNIERVAALQKGIPTVPRAQMLGELMRFKPGIAVAGTHGKTTVSSMIAHILTFGELSPTCVIGGQLLSPQGSELTGSGNYVVVEADESDASFLHLHPVIAVITNIDDDHLEAFDDDFNNLKEAFGAFLANLPFYGSAIMCEDDAATAALADKTEAHRVVRYGLSEAADIAAVNINAASDGMTYTLVAGGEQYAMKVGAWGRHNVQNALAATAVALELGVAMNTIRAALENFSGVRRRLEFYGQLTINQCNVLLVDDYAHHPKEISAALAALAAACPDRRLLLLFQPHRYSRTARLLSQLAQALAAADSIILLPVYPAGETPPPAANLDEQLAAALGDKGVLCRSETLTAVLENTVQDNDVVVCMGAGDIGALPMALWEKYHG